MTLHASADMVRKLAAKGLQTKEIMKRTGLSGSTVRKYKNAGLARNNYPKPVPSVKRDDVREMRKASLLEQVRRLESGEDFPICTPEYEEAVDYGHLWGCAEAENAKRIERALSQGKFKAILPDEPIAVSFISDQHISTGNVVDMKRMREDAELIAATPGCYAILGGDGVDNHIKIRAATLAARCQPGDQYELYSYYLSIMVNKILAMISGNHDAWTDQTAGIDMVRRIASEQKLCYAPAEARIECVVGSTTYKLAVRHQYRMNSSFNLGHAVKQWWRMGDGDFDIGCVCHHHEPHIESFNAHGEEKWACRPGSYQITSSYSRQYGFNSTHPTCPTFILYPNRKEIVGFKDLRPAIRMLTSERNKNSSKRLGAKK